MRVAPQLSTISASTPTRDLRVRHGGYDIHAAEKDPNVVFPLERLRELAVAGVIGELAPQAYSFVGATAQTRMKREAAPAWAARGRAAPRRIEDRQCHRVGHVRDAVPYG